VQKASEQKRNEEQKKQVTTPAGGKGKAAGTPAEAKAAEETESAVESVESAKAKPTTKAAPQPTQPSAGAAKLGEGEDPVPAGCSELLRVFSGPLQGVEFPGLSGATLEAKATQVRERSSALAAAREALETAERELGEALAELQRQSQQALAYAKVFAAEDADLSVTLAGIRLAPEKGKVARGRKPKSSKPGATVATEAGGANA